MSARTIPRSSAKDCAVGTAWPTYQVWKAQARSFTALEAFREGPVALSGQDEPERVGSAIVTAGLFPMLGVRPILGRTFLAGDDRPGAVPTILLGHGLWTRRYGADSGIVGRVRADQRHRAPRHRYHAAPVPLSRIRRALAADGVPRWPAWPMIDRSLSVVGRLSPGVSLEAAGLEMAGVARRLAAE